jgi:hypothetical protein
VRQFHRSLQPRWLDGVVNRTIRQYLQRRIRLALAVVVCAWAFLPINEWLAHERPNPILMMAGFGAFGAALLFIIWVRCPRCRARLGQSIAMPLALSWGTPRINFCPYCGVNLEEPLEAGPRIHPS